MYRQAALSIVGRRVRSFQTDDTIVVKDALPIQTLVGSRVREVARHGKLLTIHLENGSIDLHFGMAGRIIVDGRSPIDELVYGASSNDRWIRFGIEFDQGFLAITDPQDFRGWQPVECTMTSVQMRSILICVMLCVGIFQSAAISRECY